METNEIARPRPRYLLGTFWLVLGVLGVFGGIANGNVVAFLVSGLLVAYSVYLYRGGRFGFIIW